MAGYTANLARNYSEFLADETPEGHELDFWTEVKAADEEHARIEGIRNSYMHESEAHCYVCRRHTDHFAEHDDLVEQGFAEYDERSGSVLLTVSRQTIENYYGWNNDQAYAA